MPPEQGRTAPTPEAQSVSHGITERPLAQSMRLGLKTRGIPHTLTDGGPTEDIAVSPGHFTPVPSPHGTLVTLGATQPETGRLIRLAATLLITAKLGSQLIIRQF